jgi:hypothetical protein
VVFICGGIQGFQLGIGDLRRAGRMEWPLRILFMLGGVVLAAPGGGIMPCSNLEMISGALVLLAPATVVALLLLRAR